MVINSCFEGSNLKPIGKQPRGLTTAQHHPKERCFLAFIYRTVEADK